MGEELSHIVCINQGENEQERARQGGGGGQHLTPSIVHMPLCMCNLLVQSNL